MRIIAFVLVLLPMTLWAVDLTDTQRSAIEDRIKPYSQVCLPGDECGGAAASVASGPRSGEAVTTALVVPVTGRELLVHPCWVTRLPGHRASQKVWRCFMTVVLTVSLAQV